MIQNKGFARTKNDLMRFFSMALFQKLAMHPIPAPTMHLSTKKDYSHVGDYLPSSRNLWKSEIAIHEYLGIAWAKIMNQI